MKTKTLVRLLCIAGVALVFAVCASAQQVSGSITGAVKDSQQAVVVGGKVTLTSPDQGITREQSTRSDGTFTFALLPPGTYQIAVEVSGFKKSERKDIKIFASDRISLPDIVLEIGQMAETITVEAQAVQLETTGADRSGIVTGRQVTELAVKSRNFFDLAVTAPGVYYRPTTGTGMGQIFSNGNRQDQNNLQVDGITNVDTGNNVDILATMNVDQIAEFKILTNSQPAAIGRSAGAQVQVVTKSGSRDFHGSGYWFHRNEGLNANNWRNNMENRARNFFRYNYEGYTIGGPILLPGGFNRNREKLFFFWSQEFQNSLVPNGVQSVTVPTALQRTGDFSQTRDGSGNPVIIKDPTTGLAFANNLIPSSQRNADGVKILNFYPLPNRVGVDNGYNYQTQISDSQPRREQMLRGDYNISDKWRVFSRYLFTKSEINKAYGQWNANYNIPFAAMNFGNPGWSFITNVTTVINPTLTNEFIFGSSKNHLNIDPVDDTFNRSKLNLSYTMPFPSADKLGLIQNWRFQNVPNGPFTSFNGTPFRNFNHTWEYTDNIAKVFSSHSIKGGIYVHRSWKDQTAFTATNGDIYFNRDSANPGDTNWDFSNAYVGNFQRAEQSNVILNGQYRSYNVEWYIQDTWKVSKKLTLDAGLRFYWIQPQFDQAKQTSSFNPALYVQASAAVLMQRAINPATGAVASFNPITSTYSTANLIGTLIQTGKGFVNGLYSNGMGLAGQNGYPIGLITDRGIHYAPRLGLAYQIDSKTVIRAGSSVFYDRFQGNDVFDMLTNPPATIRPTFYYGNLATLGSSQGVFAPASVRGFDETGQVPTTYNWNFSIQRELPKSVMLDVAYVGMKSLHNLARFNLNAAPFGSAWLPQNQDPTVTNPPLDGTKTNSINFYRPYLGYGDVTISGFGSMSNYNALQVAVTRRVSSFTFGANYTWGKALGTASARDETLHPTNFRMANYGPLTYDARHLFVFNYTWDLPNGAKGFMANPVGRAVLDGWEISGITSFFTGEPDLINIGDLPGPTGSAVSGGTRNRIYTGSETVAPRPYYVGNPNNVTKSIYAWVDASTIRAPIIGQSRGLESGMRNIRKPGVNNWDLSVFKNFRLGSESRVLQIRCEMFNVWNHTQFSDFNRTVNFNSAGAISNLPTATNRFGFGAITAARDPRIIQLAARLRF